MVLVLVFSMAGIVASPEAVKADKLGPPWDTAYVAMSGSDTTGNGTEGNPWRTISHAVEELPYTVASHPDIVGAVNDPDRILVKPSAPNEYGGPANPETIYIDNPVTIESTDGPGTIADPMTVIDLTGQAGPPYVIEIVSSNVTIDGLFLTGTAVGVYAHPPVGVDYIENVEVLNSIIKVDQVEEGVGIEMFQVKYPDIINNEIYVGTEGAGLNLSVAFAYGIILYDCFTSTVTDNLLNIHGDFVATGIDMELCPKSLVDNNTINVLASGDVLAIGIYAKSSHLIDITNNTVKAEAHGEYWAVAFGIKVFWSDRADVNDNDVTTRAYVVGGPGGFLMGMGIWLLTSHESNVLRNEVEVEGVGNVSDTMLEDALSVLGVEEQEELAALDEVLLNTLGDTLSWAGGFGVVMGIKVMTSELVTVSGNSPVNVRLGLDVISGDEDSAVGGGGGVAIGIKAFASPAIRVTGNAVDVQKAVAPSRPHDVMVFIKVHAVETLEMAGGGGLAAAMGIVLAMSPGLVAGNWVSADGDLMVEIKSVPTPGDLATGSALSSVNSELLGAIYQTVTETVQSETIDVEMSGDLPSIESFASGGGVAVGIGILVLASHGTSVLNNSPVIGIGDLMATVYSKESVDGDVALASGGGLGLGIGIAVIFSMDVTVSGNTSVNGTGLADVDVDAWHDPPVGTLDAYAEGGGAGIGIGILLCGLPQFRDEAEGLEDAEGVHWMHRPVVENNVVTAEGRANPIEIAAVDDVISHEAGAIGKGLGLAVGIASVFYPSILIQGNVVNAHGDAMVDVYAEAIHEFDPWAFGGAAGIGIGIATVVSPRAQIIGNETTGTGTAYGEIGALEQVIMDSFAFGGSLGLGKGILVFDCWGALVQGNTATGLGDAETNVIAESEIPLQDAYAFGLAFGMGKGIVVVLSDEAKVIECNTAAGEGTARVTATAIADFDYDGAMGVAADIDILIIWSWSVRVNYNSIVDAVALGVNAGPIMVIDAGLLKLGPEELNARFNWWNHPTGPSGFGPGWGEPVLWTGPPVWYMPWLYVVHTEVLEEQIGKFGFAIHLSKGLNTLSTPIALEEEVVPSRRWADIVANSGLVGQYKYVDRWNPATQMWETVGPDTEIDPLDALYIYMFEECHSVILMVNSDRGHPYSMPQRQLYTEWNLIGPNPMFPMPGMPVDEALASALQTPDGLPGITQVISPVADLEHQDPWHWVPGMEPRFMKKGLGYWVWSQNEVILPGFGFTPLPHIIGW
jgi:hypothetical protein